MDNIGRELQTFVEIDFPRCSRVYGVAPCTASLSEGNPHKCFNSDKTCQDRANLDLSEVQTFVYSINQSGLPKDRTIHPALKSVTSNPIQLNLSGIDPKSSPLGKRARVVAEFEDFRDSDTGSDKYQAERRSGAAQFDGIGYDPFDQGHHFRKMRARFPYYLGNAFRIRRGYKGQPWDEMTVTNWVVSEWKGPDAGGRVQVTAKDILDLTDSKKAVAPKPSRGKLLLAIDKDATELTLTPSGIGATYADAGRVSIGREVMTFARDGDVMTLTARGVDGTQAGDHKALDVVQQCLRYEFQEPQYVIRDLEENFADVDPAFIPSDDWQASNGSWLAGIFLTRTIARPTGVSRLVSEILQLGILHWWDEETQTLQYRPNRPLEPGEAFFDVTDAANVIEGTGALDMSESQRISQLYFYHGQIDPTGPADSSSNYDKLALAFPDTNPYGQDAIKEIFNPWFGQLGDDAAAGVLAERLVERYRDTPRLFSGILDVKDREGVKVASLLRVTTALAENAIGGFEPQLMQANYVKREGDRIGFRAETFDIEGRFGFWLDDDVSVMDYDDASDEEKDFGAYWMDDDVGEFPDGTGPYVYF